VLLRRTAAVLLVASLLVLGAPAGGPSPAGAVTLTGSQNYVAIGDSITAGAAPYIANDWDMVQWASGIFWGTGNWNHLCLRAQSNPWTQRVHARLGSGTRRVAACGGAKTSDITSPQQVNFAGGWQTINQPQISYIDANTRAVSITLGGNDAGILDLIQSCVLGACDQGTDDGGPSTEFRRWNAITTVNPNTGEASVQTRLTNAFNAIAGALPAGAKVVVLLYPAFVVDPFLRPDAANACDTTGTDINITAAEATYIGEKARALNTAISTAASGRTGWQVRDLYAASQGAAGISPRHDACTALADRWVAFPGPTIPFQGQTAAVAGGGQVAPLHLNDNGHVVADQAVGPALAGA